MYRSAGFQQQNYAMRQESWSSTNGYNSNVTDWPMTTSPCITTPQLSNPCVMVNGGYGYGQQQGSNWYGNNIDGLSQFSHSSKLNNVTASDGYGTYQTNAIAVGGGGGCETYYDGNFLNNFKAQGMGCGYNSGWGSYGSQHCLTSSPINGLQKGYQRVEYWATKGV